MNKKILSIIAAVMVSSTLITACGNSADTDTSTDTNSSSLTESSTEASSNTEVTNPAQSSAIIDSPTVEVKKIASINDFKGKDPNAVAAILGNPTSENGNVSTYEKDGYTFDITYFDSVCGQIKITPQSDMKYPADATNSLKVLDITAGDADTLSPSNMIWSNQFNTYSITVTPSETDGTKLGNINVILDEQYK